MPRNLDSHFTVHVNGSITENISPNTSFGVFEGIPCLGNELTLDNILKAKRIYAYSKKLGKMEMVTGINFEDVRVGDKIRATHTINDVEITRVGVVSSKTGTIWSNGIAMANKAWENLFIELLERPLPTELGAVIRVTKLYNKSVDVICMLGFPMGGNKCWVSSKPIDGACWHQAESIQGWEPVA